MIVELPSVHQQLTPEVARQHAALPQIKGDRSLWKNRMEHLADAHERGLFHSPTWAVSYCKEDGKYYRINGKHSSNFLLGLNGSFPKGMSVTILQYQCDTLAELADLFDQFDPPISARTRGDSINVHKSLHANLNDVSKTSVAKAIGGLTWYIRTVLETSLSVKEQNQIVHQYCDFIAWADTYAGNRRMSRAGVMAAMYATWCIDVALATQFWDLVRDQNHENAKNGTRVLGRFLEITIHNPADPQTRVKWDSRAYYCKSIHAWNAWRTDSTTDLKYHAKAPLPKPRSAA